MKVYKERIQAAMQESAHRLLENSRQIQQPKLYLTKKQYEADLEGWKKLVRQKGFQNPLLKSYLT